MREYRDECKFWHKVWQDHGQPREGHAYEYKRESKRQYMYAIRRLKRRQRELQAEKFASALAKDNSRDFFSEIKRMQRRPSPINLMNGLVDEREIAQHFMTKYEALYSSVLSDPDEMQRVREIIDDTLQSSAPEVSPLISVTTVKQAIKKLKHCKHDGDEGYNSSHLIYGSDAYHRQLSAVINAMYVHGHTAAIILNASIISIPKDYGKSLTVDTNYRGIALCSSISKLLDIILLARNENAMKSSDNQFAYKRGHGTVTCTYVVKEVIQCFLNGGSNVYACFLDASKAFDRVRFDVLFSVLLERGVSALDLRLLFHQYLSQKCRALWKDSASDYFDVSNGIRQGGVASPLLFCLYLDVLLNDLERSKVGCYIENYFFGSLAYADDIVLLSPTINGLNSMLCKCENFCTATKLQFNASKSVCICFRRQREIELPTLHLSGKAMVWSDSAKHLGNLLMYNLSEEKEVMCKRGDLAGRVNVLLSNFADMSDDVKLKIFHTQCSHFYGCQAWHLNDRNVKLFYTMYNRSIRRILKLPYRTHTVLIPSLTRRPSAPVQISRRMLKFVNILLNVPGRIGRLANISINDCRSLLYGNMAYAQSHSSDSISEENAALANAIVELLNSEPAGFSRDEARECAFMLCVN